MTRRRGVALGGLDDEAEAQRAALAAARRARVGGPAERLRCAPAAPAARAPPLAAAAAAAEEEDDDEEGRLLRRLFSEPYRRCLLLLLPLPLPLPPLLLLRLPSPAPSPAAATAAEEDHGPRPAASGVPTLFPAPAAAVADVVAVVAAELVGLAPRLLLPRLDGDVFLRPEARSRRRIESSALRTSSGRSPRSMSSRSTSGPSCTIPRSSGGVSESRLPPALRGRRPEREREVDVGLAAGAPAAWDPPPLGVCWRDCGTRRVNGPSASRCVLLLLRRRLVPVLPVLPVLLLLLLVPRLLLLLRPASLPGPGRGLR